jgi:hypothetical protein
LGVLKKNDGCENVINSGPVVEIGIVQGPQKLDEGSGKMIHPGTVDQGFTVFVALFILC